MYGSSSVQDNILSCNAVCYNFTDDCAKDTLEGVTWWVYGGQRPLVSGQPEDPGAGEWVYCADCECSWVNMTIPQVLSLQPKRVLVRRCLVFYVPLLRPWSDYKNILLSGREWACRQNRKRIVNEEIISDVRTHYLARSHTYSST